MDDKPRSPRNPWIIVLALLTVLSLVVAVVALGRLYTRDSLTLVPLPPLEVTPIPGQDLPDPTAPGVVLDPDALGELILALASIVTALTGLLGLIITQLWRRREESRAEQRHTLAVERERLELERERLELEKERLALARQRNGLRGE